MQTVMDAARISMTLAFLLYASYRDYKAREVTNTVWMLFAPPAFALTFADLVLFMPSQLLLYGICVGLTASFAVILFYSGGFGGADAKALMCLALALPFFPESLLTPILGQASPISQTFFPIAVFSNSVLLAAATAVYMLLRNMIWHARTGEKLFGEGYKGVSLGSKILVLITGYRMALGKLKEKWHLYPMEDVENDPEQGLRRKLVVIPKDENREAIIGRLSTAVDEGKIQDDVWATPGLPMLIFVTLGLIIALFFGDLVWIGVRILLG